jgi:hypothetical protein
MERVPQAGKPCSGRSQRTSKVAQHRATSCLTAYARFASRSLSRELRTDGLLHTSREGTPAPLNPCVHDFKA